MGKIDITKIQPTRLCKDLRGRFVEIFGREKAGKTSTAVMWPKPLLCAFEKGYNALVGVYPADIDSWSTFKDICRQLKKPEMKELYETIIRGGTDGARLAETGVPCPNIFTGGHNFHSLEEWVPVDSMNSAVNLLLSIVKWWAK